MDYFLEYLEVKMMHICVAYYLHYTFICIRTGIVFSISCHVWKCSDVKSNTLHKEANMSTKCNLLCIVTAMFLMFNIKPAQRIMECTAQNCHLHYLLMNYLMMNNNHVHPSIQQFTKACVVADVSYKRQCTLSKFLGRV